MEREIRNPATPRLVKSDSGVNDKRKGFFAELENEARAERAQREKSIIATLSEWLRKHLQIHVEPATFFKDLQSGVVLCKILKQCVDSLDLEFYADAEPGSIRARGNVNNFLNALATVAELPSLAFEPDDVIECKNTSAVLDCVVDLVDFTAKILSLPALEFHEDAFKVPSTTAAALITITSVEGSDTQAVYFDEQRDGAGTPVEDEQMVRAETECDATAQQDLSITVDISHETEFKAEESLSPPVHSRQRTMSQQQNDFDLDLNEADEEPDVTLVFGRSNRHEEFKMRKQRGRETDSYRLRMKHHEHLVVMQELYYLLNQVDSRGTGSVSSLQSLVELCLQNHISPLKVLHPPLFPAKRTKAGLPPLTDVQVVQLQKGETAPLGYHLLQDDGGEPLNLNAGCIRADRKIGLALKRGYDNPPLTDIIVCSDDDVVPYGFECLTHTVRGFSASLNFGSGGIPLYLCLRRGSGAPLMHVDLYQGGISSCAPSFTTDTFPGTSSKRTATDKVIQLRPSGSSANLNEGNEGRPLYLVVQTDPWFFLNRLDRLVPKQLRSWDSSLEGMGAELAQEMHFGRSMICILACCWISNEVTVRNALLIFLRLTTHHEFTPSPKALNIAIQALAELNVSLMQTGFGKNRNLHQICLKVVRQVILENLPLIDTTTWNNVFELCTIHGSVDLEFNISRSLVDAVMENPSIQKLCVCGGANRNLLPRSQWCLSCRNQLLTSLRPTKWIREKVVAEIVENVVLIKTLEPQINGFLQHDFLDNDCKTHICSLSSSLYPDQSHSIPRLLSSAFLIWCKVLNEPPYETHDSLQQVETRKNRSLDMMLHVLENAPTFLKYSSSSIMLLARIVCHSLLECFILRSYSRPFFQRLLKVLMLLYKEYKSELKMEIGEIFDQVVLELLESRYASTSMKSDLLEALDLIFSSSQKLVNLYYNYDSTTSIPLFEHLISAIVQVGDSSVLAQSDIDEENAKLTKQALEILVRAQEMISRWLAGKISIKSHAAEDNGASSKKRGSASMRAQTTVDSPNLRVQVLKNNPPPTGYSASSPSPTSLLRVPGSSSEQTNAPLSLRRRSSWRERFEMSSGEQKIMEKALVLAKTTGVDPAVRYLVLHRRSKPNTPIDAREIAAFLHRNKSLDQAQVGIFLATVERDGLFRIEDFEDIRSAYLDLLDFTSMTFNQALRAFFQDSGFWVPLESEDEARCMCLIRMFAHGYVRDNPIGFSSPVVAEFLARRVLQLDTDLHLRKIKVDASKWIEQTLATYSQIQPGQRILKPITSDAMLNQIIEDESNVTLENVSPRSQSKSQSDMSESRSIKREVPANQPPSRQDLQNMYNAVATEPLERRADRLKYQQHSHLNAQMQLFKESEALVHNALAKLRSHSFFRRPFVNTSSWRIVHAMSSLTWYRFLVAFSGFVEAGLRNSDKDSFRSLDTMLLCLNGLMNGTMIMAMLKQVEETEAYVSVLAKVTYVETGVSSQENQKKALVDGSYMKQAWIRQFRELLPSEPRRACDQLAEVMQMLRAKLQRKKREKEVEELQLSLSSSVVLRNENRHLIRQESLIKVSSSSKQLKYQFCLFNDILIYGRVSNGIMRKPKTLHLTLCKVKEITDSETTNFQNLYPFRIESLKKTLTVLATTSESRSKWIRDIKRAAEQTLRQHLIRMNSASTKSLLTSESESCSLCLRGFSFFNRRHTCSRCDLNVCSNCIAARKLPDVMSRPGFSTVTSGKICDACFETSQANLTFRTSIVPSPKSYSQPSQDIIRT